MNTVPMSALRRRLSPLVLLAVAGAGMALPAVPAAAQRKAEKAQAAPKANYSKGFVAAYAPIEAQANTAGVDFAALKSTIPTLLAAASTPDDKLAAGRMIFTIGQKSQDYPTALQGIEMMLASGRADAKAQAQFNFVGAQLAYNLKDYAKARRLGQAAVAAGYAENDPQIFLADTYFAEKNYAGGLKSLSDAIAARRAAGQPVNEAWVKRGLALAYTNKMNTEAADWALMYARDFPSQASWGDAVAIAINTNNYAAPEMLDLLRLARRTNTIRTRAMVLEYIDAADARKLPNEVIAVLDAGTSARLIDNNVQVVKDARAAATSRLAADRTELPSLQRDAAAPGARLVTVMAAADTLLSYGKFAEAETLFARAAGMPGANVPLVLTRLGMAQAEQGKHAEAQATFAKVTGPRQTIAKLWSLYAAQKAAGTTIAPSPISAATAS